MSDEKDARDHSIKILYQDEHYIAFDKPPGLLVVPTPKNETNTLVNIVNRHQGPQKQERLFPCHPLDRDTSGVILFAKGKRNQELMMEQFKKARVKKCYIAFVQGRLKRPAGELKSFIADQEQRKFQRHLRPKMAVTRYKVIQTGRVFSVLEVFPLTGRTNQIRIQFRDIGHPLLGERKYAFARDYELKFRRCAL